MTTHFYYYKRRHILSSLCVFLFSSIVSQAVHSELGVNASGSFTCTAVDALGRQYHSLSSTNTFTLSIATNGEFAIDIHPLNISTDEIWLTFDGSNTYFISYTKAGLLGSRIAAIKQIHRAYVSEGDFPVAPYDDQQNRSAILWLSYASGYYLETTRTNVMPLPWMKPRWSLLAYGYRVVSELSSSSPFIPEHLRFVRDPTLDFANFDKEVNRPTLDTFEGDNAIQAWRTQLYDRQTRWVRGFIAGELQNTSFTNIYGIDFPLRFSFKIYDPDWGKRARYEYIGIVTNLTGFSGNESFRPPIIGTVAVDDSRFRYRDSQKAIDSIHYGTNPTNGWPGRDDPRLQALFKGALESPDVSRRNLPSDVRQKRIIAISILFFAMISGAVLVYCFAKKRP